MKRGVRENKRQEKWRVVANFSSPPSLQRLPYPSHKLESQGCIDYAQVCMIELIKDLDQTMRLEWRRGQGGVLEDFDMNGLALCLQGEESGQVEVSEMK